MAAPLIQVPGWSLLEVSLKVERSTILQASGCSTGSSVPLRMRLILDDHVDPPVNLNVERPWQCRDGELRTP